MSEWISVKDRLPKELDEVLVFSTTAYKKGRMSVAYWSAYSKSEPDVITWCSYTQAENYITHWMPLPVKPEEN